ncbi:MAG: methionyl-tRNA formyltransferase [Paludibacteraceae bacterium]|nr:methionyl-tRNA formyltransferase [Paludibacteraceae bacterium]
MRKEDTRIVFMGTPEFAVASLRALVENGWNVVGVVTTPDKPAGRGQKMSISAVKEYALEQGLPILQPEKLKDEAFLQELKSLQADVQVVVAFRMLPEVVWNMPPKGTFNLHASLLPQYRGAAPINWAIINGEKETGVTTFFLQHEIDTGNIILQKKTPIGDDENIGELYDRLMGIGSNAVLETMERIVAGNVQTTPQPESENLKPAPKLFKETCKLDFSDTVENVRNKIRGLSPYPAAWMDLTLADGTKTTMKVFEAQTDIQDGTSDEKGFGSLETDGKSFLRVKCGNGWLRLHDVQIAGKKRMNVKDLLNGIKL